MRLFHTLAIASLGVVLSLPAPVAAHRAWMLPSATVGGGTKPIVSFANGVTGCGASGEVVVPIKGKKKKGKLVLKTMASTGTGKSARDPDTLTIICTQ